MFLLGLLVGIIVGYALACFACGKVISPWKALTPHRGRMHNGGAHG